MHNQQYDYAGIESMYAVKTAPYRPPAYYKPSFMMMGLPPFTLETVEWMRRDPQVRLGMSIKLAPFHVVKLVINAEPNVAQFMGQQIRRFWMKAVPKILRAFWYTRSGGEIVYKIVNGRKEFWNYYDVYPSDIGVLTKGPLPVGVEIKVQSGTNDVNSIQNNVMFQSSDYTTRQEAQKPLRMFFPKGFLYLHNREFGSFSGQSEFEAAYESWTEKCDSQGAKHSRKLWFYKNAFSGGILFHPPGVFQDENGNEIPYQALARQAMETSLNGAIWTFEQKFDPISGQPMWSYVEPKLNPGGEKILDYVRHLDNEIMRGLGIPDDVVQQISGTGSYAGRSIPLMAFFISQRATLTNLFSVCDEQVFRPLCRENFGHDNYEVMAEVDIERLMGAMDGNPNTPSTNQWTREDQHGTNPHSPPQGLNGQSGNGQHQPANRLSQFSEIPLIATVPNRNYTYETTASIFNGVWDSSMIVAINPDRRDRVFMFSAQHEPEGQIAQNRSGKISHGGQFVDSEAGSTTAVKKKLMP